MLKSTTLYSLIILSLANPGDDSCPADPPFCDDGTISFDGDQGIKIYAGIEKFTEYNCGSSCLKTVSDAKYYGPFDKEEEYHLIRNIECTETSVISFEYKVAICNARNADEYTKAFVNNAKLAKKNLRSATLTLSNTGLTDVCDEELDVYEVAIASTAHIVEADLRVPAEIRVYLKNGDENEVALIYDIKYSCTATDDTPTITKDNSAFTHGEYCVQRSSDSETAEYIQEFEIDESDVSDPKPVLYNGNWVFKQDDLNGENYLFEVQDQNTSGWKWVFSAELDNDNVITDECTETASHTNALQVKETCSSSVYRINNFECPWMHPKITSIVETSWSPFAFNITDKTRMIGLLMVFCVFSCVMGMFILYVCQLLCCKSKSKRKSKKYSKVVDEDDIDGIDNIDF